MICPKCNIEYREGVTECCDCGVELIENKAAEQNRKDDWCYKFGKTTAQQAITALFFLGIIPELFASILFGRFLYLSNTYYKGISFLQNGMKTFSEREVNNLPLGVLGGIAFFIVTVLLWKVICELLIIIFRVIETYTQKNKVQ